MKTKKESVNNTMKFKETKNLFFEELNDKLSKFLSAKIKAETIFNNLVDKIESNKNGFKEKLIQVVEIDKEPTEEQKMAYILVKDILNKNDISYELTTLDIKSGYGIYIKEEELINFLERGF